MTDLCRPTPPPPPDVWLDRRLSVSASPIEGAGLFATAPIPRGTTVIRLGGRLVSSSDLDALISDADADPTSPFVDTITIDDDAHLVLPPGTIVHFGNHSCNPSLWHVGPYDLATRRALRPGDEATIDYGTHSGADHFELACRCGAEECRGRVTSDDWRLPELQERYGAHWVPALQRRLDTLGGGP